MKSYAELDLALILTDIHDPIEDNVLAGVAIPSHFREAFARDVEALAVNKYGGATFLELMDNDWEEESLNASIRTSIQLEEELHQGPIDAEFQEIKDVPPDRQLSD